MPAYTRAMENIADFTIGFALAYGSASFLYTVGLVTTVTLSSYVGRAITSAGESYISTFTAHRDRTATRHLHQYQTEQQYVVAAAKRDLESAKTNAETVAKLSPLTQGKAKQDSISQQTEHQTRANIQVTKIETKANAAVIDTSRQGQEKSVWAGSKQGVERELQKSKQDLQEQEIVHKTAVIENRGQHLANMSELNKLLATSARATTVASTENTITSQMATSDLQLLTAATNEIIGAYQALKDALNDYDRAIVKGDLAINQSDEIQQALIKTIEAENKLDTVITINQIQDKSEIHRAHTTDMAAKNTQIDRLLAKCESKTLAKLADITKNEIKREQQEITKLKSPGDKDKCEERLVKLEKLLEKTNHITTEETVLTSPNLNIN